MNPADLSSSVDEYLRQGGLITALDYAGNVKGFYAELPGERPAPVVCHDSVLPVVPVPAENAVMHISAERSIDISRRGRDAIVEALRVPAMTDDQSRKLSDLFVETVAPTPSVDPAEAELIDQLRCIRLTVRLALARLNRAFPPEETP